MIGTRESWKINSRSSKSMQLFISIFCTKQSFL